MNFQSFSRKSIYKVFFCLLMIGLMLSITGRVPKVSAQDSAADKLATHKLILESSLATTDLSHRYIIFLDGINSSAPGNNGENGFLQKRLGYIIDRLGKLGGIGLSPSRFIYFSYGAADHYFNRAEVYCLGWGTNGCSTSSELGDLASLSLSPIYEIEDTYLPISYQSQALEWLIGQIVKKDPDPSVQIDLVGFSLGGLIASYWGSHEGLTSPFRGHIHGIIAIESPLGGIPVASQCIGSLGPPICPVLKFFVGTELLRELQLPGNLPGSIVDEIPIVALNKDITFTSIQSTTDYIVNDLQIRVDYPVYGNQQFQVGRGCQHWCGAKQIHQDQDLGLGVGGIGLTTSYIPLIDVYNWIWNNHTVPLIHEKTVTWIIEALQIPSTGCPQSGGVILYFNANFDCNGQGVNYGYVQRTSAGWQNITGGMNENASSVKIPSGWSVMLYENPDRGGGKKCLNSTDSGLSDFNFLGNFQNTSVNINDHASSFEVFTTTGCKTGGTPQPTPPSGDGIEVCDVTNYGMPCKTYTYTSNSTCNNLASDGWDNKIESLRFKGAYVGGYDIILYDDSFCGVYIARYGSDANTLGMLNNLTGSLRIEKHVPPETPTPTPSDGIALCENTNWGAPCKTYTFINNSACINLAPDGWGERADSLRFFGSYVSNYDIILHDDSTCQTYNARYGTDAADLGAFKNAISSIRIEKHPIQNPTYTGGIDLCDGSNYGQPCQRFTHVANDYCINLQPYGWGGRADSLKFVDQYVGKFEVILYDDNGCNIYNARYGSDASDLGAFKNSIDSIRIERRPDPKPDLIPGPRPGRTAPVVISSVSGTTTNNTLYVGEPIFIDWGYKNNGSADALAHHVKLTISDETIIDNPFGSLNFGAMNGFDDWSIIWDTPGTFTVSLTVDPYSAVDESNEDNNAWSGQFTWVLRPPNQFSKNAPAVGATNQPLSIRLSWSESSGVSGYQYCYDTIDNNNCDTTWNDVGTATNANLASLSPDTTYYWQARATNSGGSTDADGSTWWSFSTAPLVPTVSTAVSTPSMNLGDTATVSVSLLNVPPNGYSSAEFTCTYNAAILQHSNPVFSNLFGADALTLLPSSQSGSFIAAIAGTNGNKATTSGVAFTFDVKGLQAGQTKMECTARVSKGDGTLTPLSSSGPATLTIGDGTTPTPTESATSTVTATTTGTSTPSVTPTQTPTPTITSTSTGTATPTNTPTPTSTPTPTATTQPPGTLTGRVIACKPVTVVLRNTSLQLVTTADANPDGTFTVTVPAGEYIVEAHAKGFLWARTGYAVTISSGEITTLPTITLLPGDIFQSDILIQPVIDEWDAMTIGMNYNGSTPTDADLNCDGTINVLDLELLAKIYRKTGPIVWQ